MIELDHKSPTCTGSFQRCGSHWRCDGCGAVHYHCPDVEEAVLTEIRMGALLHGLADQGAAE